jgi:hypothetical protein
MSHLKPRQIIPQHTACVSMRTISDFIQEWFFTTWSNGFIFTLSFSQKKKWEARNTWQTWLFLIGTGSPRARQAAPRWLNTLLPHVTSKYAKNRKHSATLSDWEIGRGPHLGGKQGGHNRGFFEYSHKLQTFLNNALKYWDTLAYFWWFILSLIYILVVFLFFLWIKGCAYFQMIDKCFIRWGDWSLEYD